MTAPRPARRALRPGRHAPDATGVASSEAPCVVNPNPMASKPSFPWTGKATLSARAQVVKPDVVLATYEALAGDAGALRAITWEALVLDERGRPAAAVAKAAAALGELTGRWRLLLSHAPPAKARPKHSAGEDVPALLGAADTSEPQPTV